MRVFASSDLHVDFAANRRFIEDLPKGKYDNDALIVAGDIAQSLERIAATLEHLLQLFARVFYVPGNHELWRRSEEGDSLEKFHRVLELCRRLGVETEPGQVGARWIVPLFSWYGPELDPHDRGRAEDLDRWGDFKFCRWPAGTAPAPYFRRLNQDRIRTYPGPVISFSHFLPRADLLPDVEYLRFAGLPKVAGCPRLDGQIRAIGARVHVFGHSHIRWDEVIEGVRYVQQGLGYPQGRRGRVYRFVEIS
ncbi:MAG: serine/threonine protein phosphatase [Candidatus Latescibacteria bacterium]|nr:serine/threonine protein phosphatase [Candidatus Latescibacterota bacterium]